MLINKAPRFDTGEMRGRWGRCHLRGGDARTQVFSPALISRLGGAQLRPKTRLANWLSEPRHTRHAAERKGRGGKREEEF